TPTFTCMAQSFAIGERTSCALRAGACTRARRRSLWRLRARTLSAKRAFSGLTSLCLCVVVTITMAGEMLTARLESNDFSCDHIQIHRVEGREAISQLFSFEIGLVCIEPGHLSPDEVAGANASLVFEQDGEVARTIYGMIAEVEDLLDTEPET